MREADVVRHLALVLRQQVDHGVDVAGLTVERGQTHERERIVLVAGHCLLGEGDGLVALGVVGGVQALHRNERSGRLQVCFGVGERLDRLLGSLFALGALDERVQEGPGVDAVRRLRDGLLDHGSLLRGVALALEHLGQVQRRERAVLQQVLRAAQRGFSLVPLLLLDLGDAERHPVFALAAQRDDLAEHLFGLLEAAVLHQLLRQHAAAPELGLILVPVLLEAGDQIFESDRERAPFGVLHLHGGAVEAEHLPHLIDLQRDRAGLDLLEQLIIDLVHRQHDQGVAGDPAGKRAHGSDDRSTSLQLEIGLHAARSASTNRVRLGHRLNTSTRSASMRLPRPVPLERGKKRPGVVAVWTRARNS